MGKGRLEAFSDGVIAVIITIIVLEMKVPHGTDVTGGGLWANLHLLFWLSLFPFVTGWMSENHFESLPVATYGAVLFMCGVAYYIFERVLVRNHGTDSARARALGVELKGIASVVIDAVAIMWLYPDPRIERLVAK
ncbi:MAG: TMEM175 family protein [Casimicrobiaceae bacterium]